MSREVAQNLNLKSDYHRFIPLIVALNGFKVGEIDISQRKRQFGISKYGKTGLSRTIRSLLDMISIYLLHKFSKDPFNLFGRIGILLGIVGVFILGYLTINWFQGIFIFSRPLFFLGILLVIVGVNFISLGFLAELVNYNSNSNPNSGKTAYEVY